MTPRHDHLMISMLASAAAAGLARTLTKSRIYKWGYMHILDDAFPVTSELITNAINETPGKEIHFRLSRDVGCVVIAVWDSSNRAPARRQPADLTLHALDLSPAHWDDNGGWGLTIVATLAVDCGSRPDPNGGKWVWARLKP